MAKTAGGAFEKAIREGDAAVESLAVGAEEAGVKDLFEDDQQDEDEQKRNPGVERSADDPGKQGNTEAHKGEDPASEGN